MLIDVEGLNKEYSRIDLNKINTKINDDFFKSKEKSSFILCSEYLADISRALSEANAIYKYGIDNSLGENIYDVHDKLKSLILNCYSFMVSAGLVEEGKRYLCDKLHSCIDGFNDMKMA